MLFWLNLCIVLQPVPKFLRDTLDWSDIPMSKPKPLFDKKQRESMVLSDIYGTVSGTTPRSLTRHRFATDLNRTLDVRDINGGRFRTTRQTNPLSPRYTIRVQSSLSMHSDPMHSPPLPRAESSLELRPPADLSCGLRGVSDMAMATIGPVERSHPGWRPAWDRKPERDASLRTSDIPGTAILPANALRGCEGGVWRKSARPRRGAGSPLRTDDIEGSAPHVKRDTMWRHCGRQSDPVDPVYVALDGVDGGGLLEADPLSRTRGAREPGAGHDAEGHIAAQLRRVRPPCAGTRLLAEAPLARVLPSLSESF